jgi:hypothetical protein
MMRWPNFFIVGAPRAGTTSLYTYLSGHPDIYMPLRKEPNFFCRSHVDVTRGQRPLRPIVTGEENYLSLFKDASPEALIGEASPFYLYDEDAPRRIKEKNRQARIIIILREPIDRAYSHYLQTERRGYVDKPFHEALLEDYHCSLKGVDVAHLYVELGLYYQQVRRYLNTFGDGQVRVFLYDDLASDTYGVVKEICHFLGVDFHDGRFFDPESRYNTYYRPNNAVVKRFLKVRSAYRWGVALIPHRFIPRLIHFFSNHDAKPQMDPEARKFLASLYYDEIVRLQDLISRDLTAWLDRMKVESEIQQ